MSCKWTNKLGVKVSDLTCHCRANSVESHVVGTRGLRRYVGNLLSGREYHRFAQEIILIDCRDIIIDLVHLLMI